MVGSANVYRVPPDGGTPTVFATGFTNIIDIAFGPDGSLYVLSLDADSLFGPVGPGTAGSLIRIAPGGTRSTIAGGATFTTPGGVAIADDGRIYVTLFSTSPTTRAGRTSQSIIHVVPWFVARCSLLEERN